VVLQGEGVRLEPLQAEHANGPYNRGRTAADWIYLPRPCFIDLANARQWIDEANAAADQLPFAIVETDRDRGLGSTRYLTIRPGHRSLEIGWTWLGRTSINIRVKLLLLSHAFERLACVRVEFKADCDHSPRWNGLARPARASCATT